MAVVGEGDTAVRALSGILGVATLPLAYIAGRRMAGVDGGRWALVDVPVALRGAVLDRDPHVLAGHAAGHSAATSSSTTCW